MAKSLKLHYFVDIFVFENDFDIFVSPQKFNIYLIQIINYRIMAKHYILIVFSLLFYLCAYAQSGEIQGKVSDADSGEGLPFANVTIKIAGSVTGAQTDFDGYYSIKPVPAGSYDVEVNFIGYASQITQGVLVISDKTTFLDIPMGSKSELLDEIVIVEYKVPLIEQDKTSTGNTVTKEDIENLPTRNVNSIASTSAGVYQADEGGSVNIKGSRSNATEFFIDGIRVRGSAAIPQQSIEQVTVLTGGLPAKYGDATGGVISITTRGAAEQFSGGVEVLTSQFLDPFGYNLFTGSLSGPLLKVNKGEKNEKSILGFFIAGEYLREKDDDPPATGAYVLKDEVKEFVSQNPLILNSGGSISKSMEQITQEDLELRKARPNVAKEAFGGSMKIDFAPSRNIGVTLGGTANYEKRNLPVRLYSLANEDGNPIQSSQTYRGYVRFTQRFGNQDLSAPTEDENTKQPIFSNVFYSIQLDYTKYLFDRTSARHQDRFFDYGYIGKFKSNRFPTLDFKDFPEFGDDDSTFRPVFSGFTNTGIDFTPNFDINPLLANYTNQYYDFEHSNGSLPQSFLQIESGAGIINGSRIASAQTAYNIWYNPGRVYGGQNNNDNDQYRAVINGSVDIKSGKSERSKHAIEFGLEYDQRVERGWGISPTGIWQRMRLSANSHLDALLEDSQGRPRLYVLTRDIEGEQIPFTLDDLNNTQSDLYTIDDDGEQTVNYAIVDSISVYDFASNNNNFIDDRDLLTYEYGARTSPSFFAEQLRTKLGTSIDSWVDIDNLDPSTFDINMFSALELVDAGAVGGYYGYDYLGNKLSEQPSFEDFFNERDKYGNLKLSVPAFQPIYAAAYLQDKFAFKDLVFNIGVRVDRFDANQKVLKDEYSLFGVKTVDEIPGELNRDLDGTHPENVEADWVVYGDSPIYNPSNTRDNLSTIVAYRNGNDWYDSTGEFIKDPRVLSDVNPIPVTAQSSSEGLNIQNEGFDPSTAFEDYQPQFSIMPRLAFSFNMSDNAQFFAHYDRLAQRPQGRLLATAFDYYFAVENSTGTLNNPNLKPEKTIDYQIGFKQRLSKSSALTLAGFYREMKDMVQFGRVNYAYPREYTTFLNQDFGTVKGLEVTYDLRRTGNLRILATYTLQFAEGTGSNDVTGAAVVNSGQPNLRAIFPLDFDSRHLLVTSIDYRFKGGKKYKGPMIGNFPVLAYFGLNTTIRARSGEPFTKLGGTPAPTAIFGRAGRTRLDGSPNGSRLPWNAKVDIRADKDFVFKTGNKDEGTQKENAFNLYLQVQNLFNTQNIINVYGFTGVPTDDGYLASIEGQNEISQVNNPQSFEDLYDISVNNPNNYSRPRTIRLGASFSF